MWNIPPVDGVEDCKEFAFQGIAMNNIDRAVMQGWVPVKSDDKTGVGKNWPVGPQGIRAYGEQILCKMPRARHNELQRQIDEYNDTALSTETVEKEFYQEAGEAAYGEISDR